MIAINKKEAEAVRDCYPNVFVTRTMKHRSKRHHYFCEENKRVVDLIMQMRDPNYTPRFRHLSRNKRRERYGV